MSNQNCGLVCAKSSKPVPLKDIDVKVSIQGFVANVESTLTYRNEESDPVEAVFIFPLDEQSAVYKFEAEIDGRRIIAECQEKQQARETYDDAIASGKTAMLLEEDDNSGDIFNCKLGNLPPNTTATLTFALVVELMLETDGSVRFTLPTVLNPRYNPSVEDGGVSRAAEVHYVAVNAVPYTLKFAANIQGSYTVNKVEAGKDKVNVELEQDQKTAKVSLSEKFTFDHDISLLVYYSDVYQPQAVLKKGKSEMGGLLKEDVLMLNFFPDLKDQEESSKGEFIFIIDRSGSMRGDRITSAKDTLLLFLKSLPVGCYFNIVGFGSSYSTLFENGSKEYSEKTLAAALDLQKTMDADMGGTEILRPLQFVYKLPIIEGRPRQLFLMTDGDVSNPRAVNELVGKNVQTTRVFTFGIGEGVSTSLVKGIARAGKGKAEFVTGKERLQAKVMSILKSAMKPSVSGVAVHWELPPGVTAVNIPQTAPPIFSGEKLILYALLQGETKESRNCAVRLTGDIGTTPLSYRLEFSLGESEDFLVDTAYPIHRLAAKAQIKEFEDKENISDQPESLKSDIVLVSTAANVVSRYTAFVGIDKDRNEPVEGPLVTRHIPVAYEDQLMSCGFAGMPQGRMASYGSSAVNHSKKKKAGFFSGLKMFSRNKVMMSASEDAEECCMAAAPQRQPLPGRGRGGPPPPPPPSSSGYGAPPPPPPAPIATTYDSNEDECEAVKPGLMGLIVLQNFSGSWDLTDLFSTVVGIDMKKIKAKMTIQDEAAWATAVAVAWLRKTCSSQRDEWEMIESKALRWLRQQSLGMTVDEVLQAAELCL